MAFLFSRNAKLYVELEGTGDSPSVNYVWQMPVLDGFSFSQTTESTEIVASEAGTAPARGRLLFNTALNPVEWSFSTYVRPFKTAGDTLSGALDGAANDIHAVEEVLWAMLFGCNGFTPSTALFTGASGTPHTITNNVSSTFSLASSNVSNMPDKWNLYFSFEEAGSAQKVYKLSSAVVNSATVDFDIEGIATIQWSGFAKNIVDEGTTIPSKDYYEKITDTSTFIRNKLSTIDLTRTDTSPDETYNVAITGGSISFENNITYLTPEELGIVNQPFANIAGTRTISGSLTCYLDTTAGKSGELLADLNADTTTVRNKFDMAVNIGGTSGNRLTFDIPTAHLEVPALSVEDLLTMEVTFHAQPATNDFSATNEATIIYRV